MLHKVSLLLRSGVSYNNPSNTCYCDFDYCELRNNFTDIRVRLLVFTSNRVFFFHKRCTNQLRKNCIEILLSYLINWDKMKHFHHI